MPFDHIVWDWNGTLFDDGHALITATAAAFSASGLPAVTAERYRDHFTRPIPAFYDKLAGRALTAAEHAVLDEHFHRSYARHMAAATLHPDAANALARWRQNGGTQSLLSMYPHDQLMALAQLEPIRALFTRIDGTREGNVHRKEPQLRWHLGHLDVPANRVLVVGDSVDDMEAARACGAAAVLYSPNHDWALVSRTRAADLAVPIVLSLTEAVQLALAKANETGGVDHGE